MSGGLHGLADVLPEHIPEVWDDLGQWSPVFELTPASIWVEIMKATMDNDRQPVLSPGPSRRSHFFPVRSSRLETS